MTGLVIPGSLFSLFLGARQSSLPMMTVGRPPVPNRRGRVRDERWRSLGRASGVLAKTKPGLFGRGDWRLADSMPRSSTLSQLANLTLGPASPRSGRQRPRAGIPARPGPSLRHHRQTRRFLEGRCRATRTRRGETVTLGAKTKTLPLDFKKVLNRRGTHPSGSEPRQAIRPPQSCAD